MNKTKELTGEAAAEWIAGHPEIAAANAQSVADATPTGAGPTPGPWRVLSFAASKDCRNSFVYSPRFTDGTRNSPDICRVFTTCEDERPGGEMEANARLISEAGTVRHETGLTPRELADQREMMLEALRELAAIGEGGIIERRETGKPTWHALDAVKGIARAAIRAAEGGAK